MKIDSAALNIEESHASIAFIDSIDLAEEGDETAKSMKEMMKVNNKLCSTTRGHV